MYKGTYCQSHVYKGYIAYKGVMCIKGHIASHMCILRIGAYC